MSGTTVGLDRILTSSSEVENSILISEAKEHLGNLESISGGRATPGIGWDLRDGTGAQPQDLLSDLVLSSSHLTSLGLIFFISHALVLTVLLPSGFPSFD